MREGDIVALKGREGKTGILKILRIDPASVDSLPFREGLGVGDSPTGPHSATYHCLCYFPVLSVPPLDQISALPVMVMHSPFAEQAFDSGEIVGNLPVTTEDLDGFYEYLKRTNFGRYAKETGFNPDVELPRAKQFYLQGNALGDEKRFAEAIDAYTAALDIFPIFMEALDNRGLTYMDLRDYRAAIADFQASIAYHGENIAPLCSLGECYLKLGDRQSARDVFSRCVEKWPEQPQFQRFLQMATGTPPPAQPPAPPASKPWWKFGR